MPRKNEIGELKNQQEDNQMLDPEKYEGITVFEEAYHEGRALNVRSLLVRLALHIKCITDL